MGRTIEDVLTIIAKKELVFTGAEHSHRTTRLAPFSELLMAWIIALWNCDTLKTVEDNSAVR